MLMALLLNWIALFKTAMYKLYIEALRLMLMVYHNYSNA